MRDILELTLTALSVKHTRYYVSKVYEEDPDHDNMFGLSRMLSKFGVDSSGYMCEDYHILLHETNPFIVALAQSFSIVVAMDDYIVTIRDAKGEYKIPINRFLSSWTGAVLFLRTTNESCEPDIESHIYHERIESIKKVVFSTSSGIILILVISYMHDVLMVEEWLLMLLNIIASVLCTLLVIKQIRGKDSIGDKLCHVFKKGNCSSFFDSKEAYPLLSISWAEIGLGYFLSNAIVPLVLNDYRPVMTIINLFLIIVPIWSIIYQAVNNRWCLICVLVQFIVVLQCIVILSFGMVSGEPRGAISTGILFLYSFMILAVHYIVKHLFYSRLNNEELRRLKPIITDPSVFEVLLKQQKHFDEHLAESSVILGNPNARNTVTVFSNPHCTPCADVHRKISSLLKKTDKYKVKYIFTAFKSDLERDSKYLISCFFDQEINFGELLDAWFNEGVYTPDSFIRIRGGDIGNSISDREYEIHQKWAFINQAVSTPLVIVNGYQLPRNYSISDLEYIDIE